MYVNRRHFSDSIHYQVASIETGQWSNGGGRRLVRAQLALEYKLQATCQQLLHSYKEGQNWAAVGQVANNLLTSSRRISQLKGQLSSGCDIVLDPISELEAEDLRRTPSPAGAGTDEVAVTTATQPTSVTLESFKAHSEPVDDNQDSAFSEKSEGDTSVESTSEDLPKPGQMELTLTGVELRVGVSEVVDPDSGGTSYLVDSQIVSSAGNTPGLDQSLLHQWNQFEQLRENLVAAAATEVPELSSSEDQTKSQRLSEFLSSVVQSPLLRSHPSLLEFLGIKVPVGVHWSTEEESRTPKGDLQVPQEDDESKRDQTLSDQAPFGYLPRKKDDASAAILSSSPPTRTPKDTFLSTPSPTPGSHGDSEPEQQENGLASEIEIELGKRAASGGGSREVSPNEGLKDEVSEQVEAGSGGGLTSPKGDAGGLKGSTEEVKEPSEEGGPLTAEGTSLDKECPSEEQLWDILKSFGEGKATAGDGSGVQDGVESAVASKLSSEGEGHSESVSRDLDDQMSNEGEHPEENGLPQSASVQSLSGSELPGAESPEVPYASGSELPEAESPEVPYVSGSELPEAESPEVPFVPRSGSDSMVETTTSLFHGPKPDTLHMSLMPQGIPTKAMSSENLMESSDVFEEGKIKRQASVPSQLSRRVTQSFKGAKAQVYKKATVMRSLSSKRFGVKGGRKMSNTDHGERSTVQLAPSTPSQEWDPTCLLEELYSDHRQLSKQSIPSGEAARHFGYLEKLPVGKSKASIMKGWRRRYFRAVDGNLYYYENRTAEKALGFVRLPGAKIVANPQKIELQVLEKGGMSLVVKAPNKDELNEWHRALLLESAHPTLFAPDSPTSVPTGDNPVVIIDIGACSVRAGFASEDAYPQVYFPAVCGMDAVTLEPIDCGLGAFLPQNRYDAKLIHPRRRGLRMDRADVHSLKLQATYSIVLSVLEKLNVEPQYCQVLLTLPPTMDEERNDLAEMLLAHIGFSGFFVQEQALLALYSYSTTSGIVVDIGDHIDIVPIIDGYVIEAGVTRLPFGGNAITDHFSKLITAKGIRYFSDIEVYINRYLKESLCYVSQNFDEDAAMCEANPTEYTRAAEIDRFQLPDHKAVVCLDISLFKAPEGLFSPRLWGKDVPGIHELVWKSIQHCPIDQRRELQRKIYLSGATTQLPGFKERLQKELLTLAQPGSVVEVHASGTQQHAAFIGGAVLARLSSFQDTVVTKQDWDMLGCEALKKLRAS